MVRDMGPWKSSISDAIQDDGPVEMPLPSRRVEPFMNGNHESLESQTSQGESLPGIQTLDEIDLKTMMERMRRDMMLRLDGQETMLRELLSKNFRGSIASDVGRSASHTVSSVSEATSSKLDSVNPTSSMKVCYDLQDMSNSDDADALPPDLYPKVGSPSFTPTNAVFSMYDDWDLELFERAEQSEVRRHRSKFAINGKGNRFTSTRSVGGICTTSIQRIVRHSSFAMLCAMVVVINSIFIGVEVQMSLDHPDRLPISINVIQYCFATFFIIELLLRVVADGRDFFCGEDWKWSWLDIFVVLASVWEILADALYNAFQIEGTSGLKALRIMRITRIMKVMRLMRVFRFIMAFRTLIASISDTLKSLFWALMLLAVIVYVFAVLFTQAVNDHLYDLDTPLPEREQLAAERYYSSLFDTMLSLFMAIANGVSWHELVAPLRHISVVWVALFLFYIFFTYFAVLNVVTAVFCQTAVESAQNDHASMVHSVLKNKQAHLDKLRHLFNILGDDTTGIITFKMLEDKMNSPEVRAYFEVLGLDVWDAWSFFKLLDLDQRGDVELEAFLMGCLRLRGQAKSIDLCKVIHDQAWLLKQQSQFHVNCEREFKKLRSEVRSLAGLASVNTLRQSEFEVNGTYMQ
eukprot:s1939_g5.t1